MKRELRYLIGAPLMLASTVSMAQIPGLAPSGAQNTPQVAAPASGIPPATQYKRHTPDRDGLRNRIDVEFSEIRLDQAVKMLSKQARIPIEIDPRVRANAVVSVEGRNVTIAHVLEMMVHQPATAMLMISPKNNGVLLEPYPMAEVDGKMTALRGQNAPWSDAWDGPVTAPAALQSQRIGAAAPRTVQTSEVGAFQTTGGTSLAPVAAAQPGFAGAPQAPAGSTQTGFAVLPQAPAGTQPPVATGQPGSSNTQAGPAVALPPTTAGGPAFGPAVTPGGQSIPATITTPVYAPTPQVNPGTVPVVQDPYLRDPSYRDQQAVPYPAYPGPGGYGTAGFTMNGSLSVMVTALSDKSFVVTEPGLGPKNEIGFYLTVYRVEGIGFKSGETLKEMSRVFHRSANGGRSIALPMSGRRTAPGSWSNAPGGSGQGVWPGGSVTPPRGRPGAVSPGQPEPPRVFEPTPAPGTVPADPAGAPEPVVPLPTPRAARPESSFDPRSQATPTRPGGDVLSAGRSDDDPFGED